MNQGHSLLGQPKSLEVLQQCVVRGADALGHALACRVAFRPLARFLNQPIVTFAKVVVFTCPPPIRKRIVVHDSNPPAVIYPGAPNSVL